MKDFRDLIGTLESQISEANAADTDVGEQRERNHRYYTMQPLGNERDGRSRHVTADVLDVVEDKKAYFRETFFSGRRLITFQADEGGDSDLAELRTAYVERVLQDNDFYTLCRDGWHDAFVAKRMVWHIEPDEDTTTELLDIDGASQQQVMAAVTANFSADEIVDVDTDGVEVDPQTQLATGTLRVTTATKAPRIRLIQPERYYRDPNATYPSEASYCAFEEEVTRHNLILEGFDADQVEELKTEYRFGAREEDRARKAHDSSYGALARGGSRDKGQELISSYWSYTWLDMSDHYPEAPAGPRLWRVRWGGGEVLRWADGTPAIDEVTPQMPFFEWTPYKVSHAASGLCDADLVWQVQRTSSVLKRLVVDSQQGRNNPRWEAVAGAIKNPRELLSGGLGGVVWSKMLGSVQPLASPDISPTTMGVLEMFEVEKETRSGSTRLAKGMQKEAVSEQNADNMIARLTNSANKRIMGQARDFAEFLGRVMVAIYKMGVQSDSKVYLLEAAGRQQQISPGQLPPGEPIYQITAALTPEEGAKRAMALSAAHQMLSADEHLKQLYGVQQRVSLVDDFLEALGITDSSSYMMTPGGEEHSQMMQAAQQQMQAQQEQAAQQMQAQMQLLMSQDRREWMRVQTDGLRKQAEILNLSEDNEREDYRLQTENVFRIRELDIEEKKARSA